MAKRYEYNQYEQEMLDRFSEIGRGMQSIVSSTTEISDSISNLSATSQEVASLSNQGLESSDRAVEKFDAFKSVLDQIIQQANKIKDMQGKE